MKKKTSLSSDMKSARKPQKKNRDYYWGKKVVGFEVFRLNDFGKRSLEGVQKIEE